MSFRIPLSAPDITQAEIDAVTAVLRTPQLSLGPELAAFEQQLAAYHGTSDAVAVSSGTAGLQLALLTLGIGQNDEVIVPSFAFIAVANTVHHVGATPVFVEIEPATCNLFPEAVERAITPRTRAILAVHTFGFPAPMLELRKIAGRHNLALIEDACEAIGAELEGQRAGSFGDLAVLGFYPNKQITTGEGGAVLVNRPEYAAKLRSLRNQGRGPLPAQGSGPSAPDWLNHPEIGFNFRLSELACALGRTQLARIDEILAMRRAAAARYHHLLDGIDGLERPPQSIPNGTISWFVYVVRLPIGVDAGRVRSSLAVRGIASSRYFAPIHQQPAWRTRPGFGNLSLPITESIGRRTLALPFFNRITAVQQTEVVDALRLAPLES